MTRNGMALLQSKTAWRRCCPLASLPRIRRMASHDSRQLPCSISMPRRRTVFSRKLRWPSNILARYSCAFSASIISTSTVALNLDLSSLVLTMFLWLWLLADHPRFGFDQPPALPDHFAAFRLVVAGPRLGIEAAAVAAQSVQISRASEVQEFLGKKAPADFVGRVGLLDAM